MDHRALFPSTVHGGFDQAGPAQLVEPLILTNQVALAKCTSQCLKVSPPIAFKVVFNSPGDHSVFPEVGA